MAPGCGQRLFQPHGALEALPHLPESRNTPGGLPEVTCLSLVLLEGLGPGKPERSYPGRAKAISEEVPSHLPAPLLLIPLLQGGVTFVEATLHPCSWPVSPAGILSLLLELLSHPGHCQSHGVCGATGKTGRKECLWTDS